VFYLSSLTVQLASQVSS